MGLLVLHAGQSAQCADVQCLRPSPRSCAATAAGTLHSARTGTPTLLLNYSSSHTSGDCQLILRQSARASLGGLGTEEKGAANVDNGEDAVGHRILRVDRVHHHVRRGVEEQAGGPPWLYLARLVGEHGARQWDHVDD